MVFKNTCILLIAGTFLAANAFAQSDYNQQPQEYNPYIQNNSPNQGYYGQPPQGQGNQNYSGQGYTSAPPQGGYYQHPYQQQPYPQQYYQQPYPQQPYQQQQYPQQYSQQPYQQQQTYQPPPETPEEAKPKKEKKPGKNLQSLHASMPIESEKWKIGKGEMEFSSLGIEFNWSRFRVNPSGYSSVFGIGFGFNSGEIEGRSDIDGIDFNLRFGWGLSPIQEKFVLAVHFLLGLDFKMLDDERQGYDRSATYADLMVGGDFILAYAISESFGILAGTDITTNVLGLGVLSIDSPRTDDTWIISYQFSGINIVPRLGIYFIF